MQTRIARIDVRSVETRSVVHFAIFHYDWWKHMCLRVRARRRPCAAGRSQIRSFLGFTPRKTYKKDSLRFSVSTRDSGDIDVGFKSILFI